MTQKLRGLPPKYSTGVSRIPELDAPPVSLGDYLDDTGHPDEVKKASEEPAPDSRRSRSPDAGSGRIAGRTKQDVRPDIKANLSTKPSTLSKQDEQDAANDSGLAKAEPDRRPPRRQINMRPLTLEKLEDLLHSVRSYTPQQDATMSELIHALVLIAHDAKQSLDLRNVPARGKWGSPTAKLFVDSLKNSFEEAIAQHQRHKR